MIYILKLEKRKWYVGYTSRKDGERFNEEHFVGKGSKWTKLYKPICVAEYRQGELKDENKITLELMKKYGWVNVRGGSWCKIEMSRPPRELNLVSSSERRTLKQVVGKLQINKNENKGKYCWKCKIYGHATYQC